MGANESEGEEVPDELSSLKQRLEDLYASNTFRFCKTVNLYQRNDTIHIGSFGVTYHGVRKDTLEKFVLKRLKNLNCGVDPKFYRELSMKQLDHDNILKLVDVVTGTKLDVIFFVYEHCKTNLLRLRENSEDRAMAPDQLKSIMKQLFLGLEYLHDVKSIGHLNICPKNLLLDDNGKLKISNFKLSKVFENKEEPIPTIDSNSYSPPEILLQAPTFTTAVDMWAAGCILGELLGSDILFPGESPAEVIDKTVGLLGNPNEKIMPGFNSCVGKELATAKDQPYNMLSLRFPNKTASSLNLLSALIVYNAKLRSSAKVCLTHSIFFEC